MQIRCPHCRHPVEVVDEQLLSDVTCPSCGSNISLVSADTTVAHLPAGQRRLRHFELLEQIGVGGFGAVWKARDTVLDRIVALKIPRRGQLDAAEVEYFFRDARAAAQLRHPSIVSVHEVGRDGETVFIASDFIDGANLHEWLSARPLTVREAAELVAQIAEAVQHAHERGVVHRDLKPGNILIDQDGRPHITDFGLAKRESGEVTMTVDGQILGTPAYMSPEQARGKAHEATAASDVYSLGVILFELLTGELPFRGEKRMLMLQILNDEPPSPRKLNGRIPKDLETISLKAMAKEPARRYAAANDFAADLRSYLAGKPILARPVGRAERAWRWSKRNPVVAGLTSAVVISLILGAGLSAAFAVKATKQTNLAIGRLDEANQARRQLSLQAEQLSARVYAGQLLLANLSIVNGDTATARQSLSETDTNLRSWEFARLRWLMDTSHNTFEPVESEDAFYSLTVSPDQSRVATARFDGSLEVWELASGKRLATAAAHVPNRGVLDVVYSHNGQRIITSGADGVVKIWKSADLSLFHTLSGHDNEVWGLAISADDQFVATSDRDGVIRLWKLDPPQELRSWQAHDACVWSVSFSPDGRSLASASQDHTAKIWNLVEEAEPRVLIGHNGEVDCAVYSPDGKEIATCSDDKSIRVWNATTGELQRTMLGHSDWVRRLVYCQSAPLLASASRDGAVRIWQTETGNCLMTLRGHKSYVRDVDFWSEESGSSKDEKFNRLMVVSDGDDGRLKTWNIAQHPEVWRLTGHEGPVQVLAVSPSGKLVASSDIYGRLIIREASNGETRGQIELASPPSCISFLDGDERLVAADLQGGITIWDCATGQLKVELAPLHALVPTSRQGISALAVRPDGMRIATFDDSGKVVFWDKSQESQLFEVAISTSQFTVRSACYSPDGQFIYAVGIDGVISALADADPSIARTISDSADFYSSLAISGDGRWLAAGALDGSIAIWTLESERLVNRIGGVAGIPGALCFTKDNRRLAVGDEAGAIHLWDFSTGMMLMRLTPPAEELGDYTRNVTAMAILPTGGDFVTAHDDSVVRVWRTAALLDGERPTIDELTASFSVVDPRLEKMREVYADKPNDLFDIANRFPRRGQWEPGRHVLEYLVQRYPDDHWLYFQLAVLQLYLHDEAAFRRTSQAMLERFEMGTQAAPDMGVAWRTPADIMDRTAKVCLLLPPDRRNDVARLRKLAVRASETYDANEVLDSWFAISRGLAEYRAGNYAAAKVVVLSNRNLADEQMRAADLIIAMADHRLGRADEAASRRASISQRLKEHEMQVSGDDVDWGTGWADWLICEILLREAESVVNEAPPTAPVRNAAE